MHVLGHDHVAHESETVLRPHFIERKQELVPCFRRPEPWQPPVTAKREKMQIDTTVVALQILWHRRREQSHVRPFGTNMSTPVRIRKDPPPLHTAQRWGTRRDVAVGVAHRILSQKQRPRTFVSTPTGKNL